MNYNKAIIAGNLTRDPELQYLPNGTAVAKFGLAINRKWKSESGEEKEEVTFVDVQAWAGTAELCGQYLAKGRSVMIEGRLKLDQWTDQQTQAKRQRLYVVAERVQFVGPRPEGNGTQAPRGAPPRGQAGAEAPQQDANYESDVPF